MSVSNETIINKMIAELEAAKREADNHSQVKKRMEHVRVLSELFYEPHAATTVTSVNPPHIVKNEESESNFSDEEIKAMLGNSTKRDQIKPRQTMDDDANGDSLFDF